MDDYYILYLFWVDKIHETSHVSGGLERAAANRESLSVVGSLWLGQPFKARELKDGVLEKCGLQMIYGSIQQEQSESIPVVFRFCRLQC